MYVLSGWEGSAHNSKLLTDALTLRRIALKVPQGLHKFLQKECRSDEFPVEQDNEVDPEPVNDVDPEPVNEVDPEPVFQTQEQQRTKANEWRHAIALNMWMDAEHNDNNENQ
ncbi:hypothetical protein Dsin_024345 [Dipteronia sinensis]|uniref:DDE Tnp4 domain-containing protein n=1 Tax=Dipteronia sinensis TaxID=43782 RepID=A0AAE0DVT3_9ROSI|nr:hypothetical protein Dsin_024345 [Dipteronia sinensis]